MTPPAVAAEVFGAAVTQAEHYAELLRTDGITRGLIGPREAGRIWERHILNCAAIQACISSGSRVADVGSGAGLPGIPLALARPDLSVILIEPLLRRTVFLDLAVGELALSDRVAVRRGRSDEVAAELTAGERCDVVTSRALAPLDRLVRWCAPLLAEGGEILAVKGSSASEELARHAAVLDRAGLRGEVQQLSLAATLPPTTVVRLRPI